MPHKRPKHPPLQKNEEIRTQSINQSVAQGVEVNAVELKTIELRLSGVKEAAQRSRSVFIIMSIVSSVLLMSLWNSTFSWDNEILSRPQDTNNPIQQALMNERIRNQAIPVGVLGINIRVSVSDLSVIGSVCMVVIMTWYFYSQKRENRAIVTLLQDCAKGYKERRLTKDVCFMVLQGITNNLVFIDLGKGDVPLSGLKKEEDIERFQNKKAGSRPTFLIRKVGKGLIYLPVITIIVIVSTDVYSLSTLSLVTTERETLWGVLGQSAQIKIVAFELIAILSALYTWFLCYRSTKFSKATAQTLIDYMEFLKDPEKLE